MASSKSIVVTQPAALERASKRPVHETVLEAWANSVNARTWKNYEESLLGFVDWLEHEDELARPTYTSEANTTALVRLTKFITTLAAADAHALVLRWVKFLGTKHAPNTVNVRLSALRSLTKLARQLGAISWMLEVKGPRAENVRDTRGPDLETMRRVLRKADQEEPFEMRALLRLAFENGLRGIELRELLLADVCVETTPPCVMVRGKGKSGKRPITVSRETAVVLKSIMEKRRTFVKFNTGFAVPWDAPNSYLFPSRGRPMVQLSKQALHARVAKLGKKYGIKLWPHGIRHSAITAVLDAVQGDVRKAQKFSRHARLETLIRYDDERRDVAGELTEELARRTR